ncbi:RING finger protein 151-like [Lineus longissimus]|uniref:RING finger protein 151-like n=1 Tax=Lineus longissimus TaxID=88925 RepID=UPI00315D82A0
MGYDIERFVQPINEGLLCSICRDVLKDPVQAPCEHVYCSACIQEWLIHENNCPEDRRHLWGSDLRPLFRYMRNDLEKLQIRCQNHRADCPHVCSLGSVEAHETECGYVVVKCPCEGCDKSFSRRSRDDHLKVCDFRTKPCPKGCGAAILTLVETNNHSCVSELRSTLDMMRLEMDSKVDDMKKEIELRLDAQRRHMVKRESRLQEQMEVLQNQLETVDQQMTSLVETCSLQSAEIDELKKEKSQFGDSFKTLQTELDATKKMCHCQKGKGHKGKETKDPKPFKITAL